MARPRAAQFGKDIGVSTNQAKKLINEGRRRRDGGSNILEATMTEAKTTAEKKMLTKEQKEELRKTSSKEERPELGTATILSKEDIKKMQMDPEGVQRANGGFQVRGMGAALNPREAKIR